MAKATLLLYSALLTVSIAGCYNNEPHPKTKPIIVKEKCLPIKIKVVIPEKITMDVKIEDGYVKIKKDAFIVFLKNYNYMKIELKKISKYIKIYNKIQKTTKERK
jgi:hypothetical protein